MHQASCHCGNVTISIPHLTEAATCCNCSICSRYGALWGYFKESEVDINVGELGLKSYCHGDKMINFNHCKECGCITHWSSIDSKPDAPLAVNYRIFNAAEREQVHVRYFDGADTWQFLSD